MFGLPRICLVVAVGMSLGAGARPADKAEDLMKKAVELRKVGDDQGAYPLLREAYDIGHSPRAAAQWGFCEQALGRWAEAEIHLSEALRGASDPWVQKNRMAIEQSLTTVKAHIARLEIVGEPAGAEVLVNGNLVGALPLAAPVRATAGEIEIELRAPGYLRATKSLRVDGGQYQKIIIRAERQTGAVAAGGQTSSPGSEPVVPASGPFTGGAGAAGAAGAPATPGTTPGVSEPEARSTTSPGWRPYAKWVSWGLGAVALGVGVYGIAHNRSLVADFDNGCGVDPQTGAYALPGSARNDAGCVSQKSSYESASKLAAVGLVAGAVLAVAGVVFFATEPPKAGATDAGLAAWSCAPTLSPRTEPSMICSTRF